MHRKCNSSFLILILFFFPFTLSAGSWTLVGLDGINVQSIDVHPLHPDTILASDNTNIYRTTNGGSTWQIVAGIPAREILFHPLYPDTVFAIWGNGSYSDGIWRSVNAGESFDILKYLYMATSLAIPNRPPGHMLAGLDSSGGVWRSTDEGQTWFPYSDSLTDRNVLSLFYVDPLDSTCLPLAGTSTGIFHFTGFWTKSNSENLPCVSMSGSEVGQPAYAALEDGSWSDGVYKSTDYGVNWIVSWYWIYITSVLANPLNSQVVFAADSGYGVIMTANGGSNWVEINENLGDYNVNDLAMSRSDTNFLYAATRSGVYRYDWTPGIMEAKEKGSVKFSAKHPSLATCGSQFLVTCDSPGSMLGNEILLTLWDITGRKLLSMKLQTESAKTEFQFELP
ncbi:MAG: hypothetical protein E3J87_05775, partial [Candidatus Cloacimonadota bacterium]